MSNLAVFLIVGALVWITISIYILLLLFFPEWVGISGGSLFKKKNKSHQEDNSSPKQTSD